MTPSSDSEKQNDMSSTNRKHDDSTTESLNASQNSVTETMEPTDSPNRFETPSCSLDRDGNGPEEGPERDSGIPCPVVSRHEEQTQAVTNDIDQNVASDTIMAVSEALVPRTETATPTPVVLDQSNSRKRRKSARNTNRLSWSKTKSSLEYRRFEELFFREDDSHPASTCGIHRIRSASSSPEETREQEAFTSSSTLVRETRLFQIGNLTLQQVHVSPNIYLIDHFLTSAELEYFQQTIGKGRFQRSFVDAINVASETTDNADGQEDEHVDSTSSRDTAQNTAQNKELCTSTDDTASQPRQHSTFDDQHRTSTFVSFQKQQDRVISAIEQRAATLLGCWSPVARIEPLQLVRYRPGQFFGVHHDLGDWHADSGHVTVPPKSLLVKRRVATVFCYLNNLPSSEAGGETHFPLANELSIRPKEGRAVLFSNIRATGQPDPRTIHAGNRVTEGTKYGLNIWICES